MAGGGGMTDEEWNNDPRTKALVRDYEDLELAQHVLSVKVVSAAKARKAIEAHMQSIVDLLDETTGLDELPRRLMDPDGLPPQPVPPRRRSSARASFRKVSE
jgi:hypothetical protein